MSYAPQPKQIIPCPAGVTQEMANTYRDAKIAFFENIFTKEDQLKYPKQVYSTIINSVDAQGQTLEQRIGTINTKAMMSQIMFHLMTGHHTTP